VPASRIFVQSMDKNPHSRNPPPKRHPVQDNKASKFILQIVGPRARRSDSKKAAPGGKRRPPTGDRSPRPAGRGARPDRTVTARTVIGTPPGVTVTRSPSRRDRWSVMDPAGRPGPDACIWAPRRPARRGPTLRTHGRSFTRPAATSRRHRQQRPGGGQRAGH
jgi:hypothetical protein